MISSPCHNALLSLVIIIPLTGCDVSAKEERAALHSCYFEVDGPAPQNAIELKHHEIEVLESADGSIVAKTNIASIETDQIVKIGKSLDGTMNEVRAGSDHELELSTGEYPKSGWALSPRHEGSELHVLEWNGSSDEKTLVGRCSTAWGDSAEMLFANSELAQ